MLHSLLQQDEGCGGVHPEVLAGGLPVVSQVRRPVPLDEQIQELQGRKTNKNEVVSKQVAYLNHGKGPEQVVLTRKAMFCSLNLLEPYCMPDVLPCWRV